MYMNELGLVSGAGHWQGTSMVDHSAEPQHPTAELSEALKEPNLFLNRELSWLRFNLRVLEEAEDQRHPLLERVKFLTIFATNLDEFFMIRVSGLRRQVASGAGGTTPDGMTPSEQILAINRELIAHCERYDVCWKQDILPGLRDAGICVCSMRSWRRGRERHYDSTFSARSFPR